MPVLRLSASSVFPRSPGRPRAKLPALWQKGVPRAMLHVKGPGDLCQEGPPAELPHPREPVLKPLLRAGGPQSLALADWAKCEWLTQAGMYLPPGT